MTAVPRLPTRTGAEMPVLGLGTWRMGEDPARRGDEVEALQLGLDLGMTLIDTAEMYADGGAEEVVAGALDGRRDGVFLVSKVLPRNASRSGTVEAAERSLRRLRTDRIDLYLLHWPGPHPLEETLAGFLQLRESGKVRHFGLSNFDVPAMEAAGSIAGGNELAASQVLYNLGRRGIERRHLPWCRERGIAVMAYSPLGHGDLLRRSPFRGRVRRRALESVAARHGATPARVAVAWTLSRPGIVAIPKAATRAHVRDDRGSLDLELSAEDHAELDAAFPGPAADAPLETL